MGYSEIWMDCGIVLDCSMVIDWNLTIKNGAIICGWTILYLDELNLPHCDVTAMMIVLFSSGPESYQGGRAVLAKLRAGRLSQGRFIQFPGTFVF